MTVGEPVSPTPDYLQQSILQRVVTQGKNTLRSGVIPCISLMGAALS